MTPSNDFDVAGAATTVMVAILLGVLLLAVIRSIRHRGENDWMLSAFFSKPREYQRSVLTVCPVCGYDLRASPLLCPECGHANGAVVIVPPQVLQERLAASTRILTDRIATVRSHADGVEEMEG